MHGWIIPFCLLLSVAATAESGCIDGKITDAHGAPIKDMLVQAYGMEDSRTHYAQTDENGVYHLTELTDGKYDIVTRNQDLGYVDSNNFDFTDNTERLVVKVHAPSGCTPLNIQREPQAARLRLKLRDFATGQPIDRPEAMFRIADGFHGWNQVSLYGRELLVPPSKSLEVKVGARGYTDAAVIEIGPMNPGQVRDVSVSLQPLGLGCLTGTVFDENHKPLQGVQVQPLLETNTLNAKSLFATTDEYGRFEMRDLHPGTYRLSVFSKEKGYDAFSTMKSYGKYPEARVEASASCADIRIDLAPTQARLRVHVVEAGTQKPIKHYKFRVKPASGPWWYVESIEPEALVPPGKPCSLQVQAEGYETSAPLNLGALQSGEVRDLMVELRARTGTAGN